MKGLKIMTKLLKTITTIAALATTLITVAFMRPLNRQLTTAVMQEQKWYRTDLLQGRQRKATHSPAG